MENQVMKKLAAACLAPGALQAGMALPDVDIGLLGIGAHRSPIFHSAAIPLAAACGMRWLRRKIHARNPSLARWVGGIGDTVVGLGAMAVGAHLLIDVFQPKAVLFPLIGSLVGGTLVDDGLWLGANGLASIAIGIRCLRRAWLDESEHLALAEPEHA